MPRLFRTRVLVATALVCLAVTPLLACSVPVFRYALERWPTDEYEVLVFHRGALTAEQHSLLAAFEAAGETAIDEANVSVRPVDLDADPAPELSALWEAQEEASLPWIVTRFPRKTGLASLAWSGPLSDENVKRIVDSPARREIAKRILEGESAVFVFLEIGDAERDEAAHQLLATELERLETDLHLPEIEPQDLEQGLLDADPEDLKLDFSTVRLSRDDPAEAFFIANLLATESDLRDFAQPMVFPVFGRGRVLYAIVGKGIHAGTISEACTQLIGPCTCTVKEENPGVDLVMAVDWDKRVESSIGVNVPEPPLAGLGAFTDSLSGRVVEQKGETIVAASLADEVALSTEAEEDTSLAPEPSGEPSDDSERRTVPSVTQGDTKENSSTVAAEPPSENSTPKQVAASSSPLVRNLLIVGILGVVVVLGASVVMLRRNG